MTDCNEGLEDCKFGVVPTIEVVDLETKEVKDSTQHTSSVGVPYVAAMASKYLQIKRMVEGGIDTFVRVIDASGDAVKALRDK